MGAAWSWALLHAPLQCAVIQLPLLLEVKTLDSPNQPKRRRLYSLCFLPATYLRNVEEKLTHNKLILREELRILLHLCDSRDDMELAKKAIYRWGISLEICQHRSLLTLFFFLHSLLHLTSFHLSLTHWWLSNLLSTCPYTELQTFTFIYHTFTRFLPYARDWR